MEINNFVFIIIYPICFSLGFLNFFISILIFLIHFKQIYFRQRFFNVIYYIVLNELIISLIIIFGLFFQIFNFEYIYILGIIFYFSFNIIIIYNIQILFYLLNEPEKNKDLIKKDIKSNNLSITFTPYNFKKFHYSSFFISLFLTLIYIVLIFFKFNKNKGFIINLEKKYTITIFLFFIPAFFYFFISLIYFFSKKIDTSSVKIYLKSYSLFTTFSSFIYLLIPLIIFIIQKKYNDDDKKLDLINLITYFYISLSSSIFNIYRIKCIYIKNVLNSNGNKFCNRFKKALKIIFCGDKIKTLNIIDFNNPYIYHSLSTQGDFTEQFIENDADISKCAPDL